MAKGDFFWFTRGDKSYLVDDPATIKELDEVMMSQNPLVLGLDGKNLEQTFVYKTDGKDGDLVVMPDGKDGDLVVTPGDKHQKKIIIRKKDLNVNVDVDIEKQMAAVQEALKKIENKLSKEEFANLEERMSELDKKLSKMQTKIDVDVNADVQAALMNLDKVTSDIKVQTDVKLLDENKVKAIIEECLKNGKARPVE
jgi:hypothetical protein